MDRVATAADVPKPTPRKRTPKRAVAVKTGVADAAPVKLRGTTRKAMVEAQRELQEQCKAAEQFAGHEEFSASLARGDVGRKSAMRKWEDENFPYEKPDYALENRRKRQAATDTWITVVTVFGVIVIIGLMAWWVG